MCTTWLRMMRPATTEIRIAISRLPPVMRARMPNRFRRMAQHSRGIRCQPEPDAARRDDPDRCGDGVELLAQVAHVLIHDVRVDEAARAPDRLENVCAR